MKLIIHNLLVTPLVLVRATVIIGCYMAATACVRISDGAVWMSDKAARLPAWKK